ncbi:MAG: putative transcriptional regulator [candidate division NC10 bacterium CSP1-5]|nr:MAG: putative transcriptional regulator [candidate division NC10 bacterium CSP1-5]
MAQERKAKEIGRRITGILEAKGWRKTDLIRRSGLKQASVYEWLRGEAEPRGEALSKIAQALEVSTDYLLGSDPVYSRLTYRQVAAKESLRLSLRALDIRPGHADYLMYEELGSLDGAPKSVTGWRDFITQFLPKISEHLRADSPRQGGDRPRKVFPLQRPDTPAGGRKRRGL